MPRSRQRAFAASAAALAAFAVHQARYVLMPDPGAESGHGYLLYAAPLITLALAASVGVALLRLTGSRDDGGEWPAAPFTVRWLGASVLLVCVYGAQELAEGHAADVVGRGAWLVLPLAPAAGLVLTVVLGRARQVLRAGARALRRVARPARLSFSTVVSWRSAPTPATRRRSPVTAPGAGRGPPLPVG